ncbi:BREX protein BrxB domain-containing protein [Parabacteroides sp. An277]|uniref:BREX protein BrxB domain-containing protein n=1 Tax=Parabacteroides sp. An277 TaxID=1965619 RepID=UPI001EF68C57|nr:BREX protein BrxB domain-containing protein [Parabacteroides sp. An277]
MINCVHTVPLWIGSIYPYLRTNHLLANYEQYNKSNRYKIIVFYPGEKEGNIFRLFNRVDDQHIYRATLSYLFYGNRSISTKSYSPSLASWS